MTPEKQAGVNSYPKVDAGIWLPKKYTENIL